MPERNRRYASIALPTPVNKPFTYLIPDELADAADFGCRALVPFGKHMLSGFIVGISDNPGDVPISKLKPIADIMDDEPVFDDHMYALAVWIADYYLSSAGEVLKAAMPFGTMVRSRLRLFPAEAPTDKTEHLSERQMHVLGGIASTNGILLRTLERDAGFPVSTIVRALEKKGLVRIEREMTSPSVKPRTVRYVLPASAPPGYIPSKAREQARCADIIRGFPEGIALSELLERHGFSRGVVNAVVKAGWAYYDEVEITRETAILDQEAIDADHPLTAEQRTCFETVMSEAANDKPRPVLVRGVTGSGKTRLYIEAVREVLKSGKSAIILVPEISLTPQTTRFFTSVFPGRVAVMHSAMSPGERYDMWRLIHHGERDVVIGPRSAVFAPLLNPGIIIVDEEHDASYKQNDISPRYHARDTAVMRGYLLGIPVILGSATPSLESWQNTQSGKYILSTLSKRVMARPLPEIVTVDMRGERKSGNNSSLSIRLREEIALRCERGEKSIILINRRGFATGVQCRGCGEVLMCPHCATPLTFHSSKGLALCHICGHEQLVLEHCPQCGSNDLNFRGMGTQRIEKELAAVLPAGSIVRMDSDTTSAHNAHFRLLEEFRSGSASVLLGTQMVAKGLDFPEVTLVGIISADSMLFLPDFRAGERTFQLITQVAGRAGRGCTAGTVVLQTYNTDNYAIEAAIAQDYEAFAASEAAIREEIAFPPFSRLVLIETVSDDIDAVRGCANDIAGYLVKYVPEDTEVMGPTDAPIPRVRGRHRMHILLKSPKITKILPLIRYTAGKLQSGPVTVTVDVDPLDLM